MGVIEHSTALDSYDYIICGGGTSGPVVAARLAEDASLRVLLVEAGKDSKDMENVHMVGGWSNNFDTEADWNIVTEPSAGANSRRVKASRGKFLGGSSGCNGTLCVRGTRQDYDDWGMPGWSGEDMWRCMSKVESFHGKDWFEADDASHGTSGPLHTEPMDLAPISKLMLDSMVDAGLPLHHDMFSDGKVAHGCGHAVRTSYQGLRTTGADLTRPERKNLDILVETMVDRVIIEGEGADARAAAVVLVTKDGDRKTIKARDEIVISCGTYCTPAVLMRSGIGGKDELAEHGIECKADLPGVGKNLMDHMIVFIFYEVQPPGLTTDHLLYHTNSLATSYQQWQSSHSGVLSHFPFGAFAYARLDSRLASSPLWSSAPRLPGRDPMGLTPAQPNVEFFTTECYGGPKQFADFPVEQKHAFSIIAESFAPRSRGSVTIRSKDPAETPVVDHNYLADELDLEVLAEACALGNEIVTKGKGTREVLAGSWPKELTHHTYTSREEWKPYVKENATTCYHPGGTAKMGLVGDRAAVVDERLRVIGVKGLRVADCSIMPTLNQGHTQMPAYGIGEKAAEMIREDRGAKISSTYVGTQTASKPGAELQEVAAATTARAA